MTSNNNACVVCHDESALMAVVSCGHVCLCSSCSDACTSNRTGSRVCALCFRNIQTVLRIYMGRQWQLSFRKSLWTAKIDSHRYQRVDQEYWARHSSSILREWLSQGESCVCLQGLSGSTSQIRYEQKAQQYTSQKLESLLKSSSPTTVKNKFVPTLRALYVVVDVPL